LPQIIAFLDDTPSENWIIALVALAFFFVGIENLLYANISSGIGLIGTGLFLSFFLALAYRKWKKNINQAEVESEMGKDTEIWQDLGVSEKEFERITQLCGHAEIDYPTWSKVIVPPTKSKVIVHLYPEKEDRIKAWFMFMEGFDAGLAHERRKHEPKD